MDTQYTHRKHTPQVFIMSGNYSSIYPHKYVEPTDAPSSTERKVMLFKYRAVVSEFKRKSEKQLVVVGGNDVANPHREKKPKRIDVPEPILSVLMRYRRTSALYGIWFFRPTG